MNKENCALKLVDEIILYYDARSKKISKWTKVLFKEIKYLPTFMKNKSVIFDITLENEPCADYLP